MIKILLFFLSFCVHHQVYKNKIELNQEIQKNQTILNLPKEENDTLKNAIESKKEIALIFPENNNFDDIILDSLIFKLIISQNSSDENYNNLKIHFYYLNQDDKFLKRNDNNIQVAILALNYNLSSKICNQYFQNIPCLSFAKHYNHNVSSNFYPLGFSYDDQLDSIFKYLLENNKKEIIFMLPSTKNGQEFAKTIFAKVNNYNNINIANVFFYNNNDINLSVSSTIKKISKSLSRKIKIDKNGKHIKYKFQKNKTSKDDDLDTQKVIVDTIFIMSDEDFKYENMLNNLNEFNMFEKNILFLSNQIKIDPNANNNLLQNFVFIGNQFDLLDSFKENFQNYFSYPPNYISYIAYDIFSTSLLDEISKQNQINGLLGNITFYPIQRRHFDIYRYNEETNLFEKK